MTNTGNASLEPLSQPMASSVRVVVVDDHELVRDGIRMLLSSVPSIEVCGEAADAAIARDLIQRAQPGIVIVDLTLGEENGLDLIKWIKKGYPDTKVIVLTMHDEKVYGERALRAGASGYVDKQDSARTIVTAIAQVCQGDLYFSEELTRRVMQRAAGGMDPGSSPLEGLSDRELEVFRLIGQGKTSRQVATILKIAPSTVETYRERLKVKLDLTNSAELVQHATLWVLENR